MKEFYVKVYKREAGLVVAACDKGVCGRTLKTEDADIFINPRFFNEREASSSEILDLLKRCYSANLFGEKIIELAKKAGLVDSKQVKIVDGVPHAHIFVMSI